MTGIEHSILATGLLAIFYYVGMHVGKKEKIEDIVNTMLDKLERGNFIKVELDEKTGEKELIALDKATWVVYSIIWNGKGIMIYKTLGDAINAAKEMCAVLDTYVKITKAKDGY